MKIGSIRLTSPAIFFVLIVMSAFSIYPQTAASTDSTERGAKDRSSFVLKRGDNEFGIFGATSVNTPSLIGTVTDARLTFVGLRYGRVIAAHRAVALEYTIDAMPVVVVSQPESILTQISPGVFNVQTIHRSVYGAGISPIGFKLNFRRERRVQPFVSTSGGVMYFSRQVPAAGSSQFNFTFDFAGGIQVFASRRRAVTVGYQYRHISNGYTADFNPGLDANMISVGFSIFR